MNRTSGPGEVESPWRERGAYHSSRRRLTWASSCSSSRPASASCQGAISRRRYLRRSWSDRAVGDAGWLRGQSAVRDHDVADGELAPPRFLFVNEPGEGGALARAHAAVNDEVPGLVARDERADVLLQPSPPAGALGGEPRRVGHIAGGEDVEVVGGVAELAGTGRVLDQADLAQILATKTGGVLIGVPESGEDHGMNAGKRGVPSGRTAAVMVLVPAVRRLRGARGQPFLRALPLDHVSRLGGPRLARSRPRARG